MSAQTALPPDHDPLPPNPDSGALEPKKKKHKAGTLRRALSWLRGRKKKKPEAKFQESKEKSKTDGEPQPTPAEENETSDNAFFPIGRTPLLEDIHNQAQEGLKSLQRREKHQSKYPSQEEEKSPEPEADKNDGDFRNRSLSCTTENTDDTMSVRSEMIQRKGSTFKPHDSPRTPSSRGRRRREKRATVVGVPQHIAAELGLHNSSSHRGIYELFPRGNSEKTEVVNMANGVQGEKREFVKIPTVDGTPTSKPHAGAYISLAALEQTEAALQRHIDKVYQDDSCIGRKSDLKVSPLLLRPKSLAVPGMTTHSHQSDPMSPVMSISPQATYMSKIIPNAVLPPMVDVVALTRSSVRTLSRCSLATASPASVRGSLHRGRGRSSSSDTWSRSQSTETIVSDSSTISSRGGDNVLEVNETHGSGLNTGRASPAPSTGTQDGSDAASLCSGRSSVRSVSLRKSKKAPPPPKRTYSLQQQREMGLPPRPDKKPTTKSSGAKDPWILRTEKVIIENDVFLPLDGPKLSSPSKSDRTLSPSSGYSSQSGTPTMPVRSLLESPGCRRKTPPKPERSSLKSASSIPVNSSSSTDSNYTLLSSPLKAGSSVGDQEGQDLIPPHPIVPAPSCPPPSKVNLLGTPAVTPTPSPPPSHHPTPPPVRKSESDKEVAPVTQDKDAQKESLWPPPPPVTSDVHDLSMADFPPPDEEFLLPPPPSESEVCGSLRSSDNFTVNTTNKVDALDVEMPQSKNGNFVEDPHSEPVPSSSTEKPCTAMHILAKESSSASVPHAPTEFSESVVSSSTETKIVATKLATNSLPDSASIIYRPHFVATSVAKNEPEETLEASVPLVTGDQSVTTPESKYTTTCIAPTMSSSLTKTSVSIVPSIATNPVIVQAADSSLPKSNVWKPTSAPVPKESVTIQTASSVQKEDANLPIVTPSLLQMVRLRSVQARGPQIPLTHTLSGLPAPQKPVRKSLSQRSPQGSDSSPVESPTAPSHSPYKPPNSPSANKSPASAASFVFARTSKRFVFEPSVSQESESSLKKDLVEEIKSHGSPRSPDGKPPLQRKPSKIPPPVARKPSVGIPRTPTIPPVSPISTVDTNGSVFTPRDDGSPSPSSGSNAVTTQAEENHKGHLEQA